MKKCIIYLITAAFLLIGMPWLTVTFAGSNGMAICFILFFAINPLFSLVSGVFAGNDIKKRWIFPLFTASLFILGAWLLFGMEEPAYLRYGSIYLAIGVIAMLISGFVKSRKT